MPTIIDSLVMKLGLDPADYLKKSKEVDSASKKTDDGLKKITVASKDTSKGFTEMAGTAVKFLAVIGGTAAIKMFVSDLVESSSAIGRLSQNLGVSVSAISAWSNAVEQVGGSAQGLQGTLSMLSRARTEFQLTGESPLIKYFSALGMGAGELAQSPIQQMFDLHKRFQGMDRTTANNMGLMMGIDQGTMNLILLSNKEFERMMKKQKEYAEQLNKFAPAAMKLKESLVQLKQNFVLFGLELLQRALPALEWLLGIFEKFGKWCQSNMGFIEKFLTVLAVGLGAVALAALPISITVAAIVALAAAVALLWDDYSVWKKGGDSFIDWGAWEPGIRKAIEALDRFDGRLRTLIYFTVRGAQLMKDALSGNWAGVGLTMAQMKNEDPSKFGITSQSQKDAGALENTVAGAFTRNTNGVSLEDATRQAAIVSLHTGIAPNLLIAQWLHETGGLKNRGATQLNNLAGIRDPKTGQYKSFATLDDFGTYYAHMMRQGGRYSGIEGATSYNDFAARLKAGGYYEDTQANYSAGMNRWGNRGNTPYSQALMGIPGASSGATLATAAGPGQGVDKSVTTTIGEVRVYTAATDAPGIARDMKRALDYQFTAQANTGVS
jgi:hypothetical protein